MRPNITRLLTTLGLALSVAACTAGGPSATGTDARGGGSGDAVAAVATTTVLSDLVARVGGDRVTVTSLVPRGGDVHTFDPSPADMRTVAGADLLVANGLGLDEWLVDMAADAGAEHGRIVELGEDLDGVTYLSDDAHEGDAHEGDAHEGDAHEGDAHEGDAVNPHLWLNVAYARKYVAKLADVLGTVDPEHASTYESNAATYDARLRDLDTWAREQIAAIPEGDRKIVSFHEAFPYLADAYGLEIVGVAVDAPGQDPSAGEIAALVEAIRASGVKAIFSEAQFPRDLADRIAAETGATVEADLYNDSLGDPPVDSYEGLIRWDIEQIVGALR